MAQKKTTKRTTKKTKRSEKFEPNKMSLAIASAAVSTLVLMAAIMVE